MSARGDRSPVRARSRPRASAATSVAALVAFGLPFSFAFAGGAPLRAPAAQAQSGPVATDGPPATPPARTDAPPTVAPPPTTAADGGDTTTSLDLLPPEEPPTRRIASTVPASSTSAPAASSTTTTVVPGPADPTLGPVCASAVGATREAKPCRIVAYYGTPAAPSMGILGRLPRPDMPASLAADVRLWATADPTVTTRCAFEVISIVAQRSAGPSGLYRARIGPVALNEIIALARANGCLTILDLQVGQSSVPVELPYFLPWLAQPDVHLALDPEWDMPAGVVPGSRIGSMEATDINSAIASMTQLVRERRLPPKLVIVHRFRDFMIVNPTEIRPTPEIRLLVNMDGFGPPATKIAVYGRVRNGLAASLTGFKLFTKNDVPMLGPKDVLPLVPPPMFVNYQ